MIRALALLALAASATPVVAGLAGCALDDRGSAPVTPASGAGGGAGGSSGTGDGTTASTGDGATTGATATGSGGATGTGSAGGSTSAAGSAGGGGGEAPGGCGDGVIDPGEECDGPAPCAGCVMQCPPSWTKAATGTCYGRAESEGRGDEVVARCDATRDQVVIDASVVLQPATPDVLDDLPTVALVCGDEIADDGCWIGADDRAVEGTFAWVGDDDFAYPGGLSPWAEGEPSGVEDDEDCVEVQLPDEGGDRPLHDEECPESKRTLCEIVPPGTPAGG